MSSEIYDPLQADLNCTANIEAIIVLLDSLIDSIRKKRTKWQLKLSLKEIKK